MGSSDTMTLFTSTEAFQYDGNRKIIIGDSQSIKSYLGCRGI